MAKITLLPGFTPPCSRQEYYDMKDQKKQMMDEMRMCKRKTFWPGYEKLMNARIGQGALPAEETFDLEGDR